MPNLGYCCINTELRKKKIFTSRGMIKRTFLEKGVVYASELAYQNLLDLKTHLEWNVNNNISLFRMSSGLFPWMSEYEITDACELQPIYDITSDISDYIKENNLRITFHPDHFNVLASKNKDVVKKTIKELNQHAEVMDLLGLPQTYEAPINIHVNTTQGGKSASLKRFRENFAFLSDSCQRRLVVENDDKTSQYTVQDLYEGLSTKIDIPITFDYHHHRLHSGGHAERIAIEIAHDTWPRDIRALAHYSSSRLLHEQKGCREQAHADYIYERINTYGLRLDIELEAKAKEQALLRYRREFL